MLKIEHLTKVYGDKKAVDDLSLTIESGEIYGFIGHNGAGKTTTLKSVAGILKFDEGEIEIGGVSVKKNPLKCKESLAYIPDNPDLYEFMTGIQFLNFIADVFKVDSDARAERIRKYADLFELTNDLAQPIATYSHGMKQKLAIIAALVHEPKLMILDEPFVGLDPKAAHTLKRNVGVTPEGMPTRRLRDRFAIDWACLTVRRCSSTTSRAPAQNAAPASVGAAPLLLRLNTSKPSSRSTAPTCCMTDCGVTPILRAACMKLPASATASTASSWLKFIATPNGSLPPA